MPILDDELHESNETVWLTLSDAENAAIGGVNPAPLIIETDEMSVHLPATLAGYYNCEDCAPPCDPSNNYCEDNDTSWEAYGPLAPGVPYRAYPNDQDDYYFFELTSAQSVLVWLTNYQATGDLLLYRRTPNGDRELVGHWGMGGSEMEISRTLQAGTYYVRVYTARYHTDLYLYTLQVSLSPSEQ